MLKWGITGCSVVKILPTTAGDTGLIPGSGRSPREGSDNLLQYSCLGNSMDRRAWWARVHSVTNRQDWALTHIYTKIQI